MNTGSDHDRRMFAVIDGHFLVAPHGYPYSHLEWLYAILGYADEARVRKVYQECTRGFWRDGLMCCYTEGNTFSRYVKQTDVAVAFAILDPWLGVRELHLGMPAKVQIEGDEMHKYVGKKT